MKVKWRQHEIILITVSGLILLISYLWNIIHLSKEMIDISYENVFREKRVPFNLYKNVIFPDIGSGILIYLCYLWINLYSIPQLLPTKKFEAGASGIATSFPKFSSQRLVKKINNKYVRLFMQLAIIIFVLGVALDTATYFSHEWQFHYPGFSILFNKNIPESQLNVSRGFFDTAALLVLYGLYVLLREVITNAIQFSKQKAYNISICNKVTSFIIQFACAVIFLKAFNIIREQQFFLSLYLYVPALFAMYISNVYWLFPMKGDQPFFSKTIITRLLLTSLIYSIPLTVFIHEQLFVALLYSWAEQLLIVTPLTWWYYQANKEKILQLKVVETALVKSKADLQFLRLQINPHFLFNVLNTLYGTALQENAERTAEGIQKLGDMMRFMLHENNLDFIDMDKEIEYLKNYISLQKLRTESSPHISIEDKISEQNCKHKIAPMLLIPFVENAFKHGISLKEKSWIKINLECMENNILFEVQNSMHEKLDSDPEKDKSGIGFKNVLERLKLIYGNRFQISVNGDGKDFFVKLLIETGLHTYSA